MAVLPSGLHEASQAMGPERAAVVTACILQRISEINSPGGYLRSLARKLQEAHHGDYEHITSRADESLGRTAI